MKFSMTIFISTPYVCRMIFIFPCSQKRCVGPRSAGPISGPRPGSGYWAVHRNRDRFFNRRSLSKNNPMIAAPPPPQDDFQKNRKKSKQTPWFASHHDQTTTLPRSPKQTPWHAIHHDPTTTRPVWIIIINNSFLFVLWCRRARSVQRYQRPLRKPVCAEFIHHIVNCFFINTIFTNIHRFEMRIFTT